MCSLSMSSAASVRATMLTVWARSPRGFADSSEVKAAGTCTGSPPAPLRGEAVLSAGSQAHSPARLVLMAITWFLRLMFSWLSLQERHRIRLCSPSPALSLMRAIP